MTMNFKAQILQGIPAQLPQKKLLNQKTDHAPVRVNVLSDEEKKLSLRNALRYFPAAWHQELAVEFLAELQNYGRIYMYRFMPDYEIYARPLDQYPFKSLQAGCIMLMIQNNLDPVAQHPQELITYGGNGASFRTGHSILLPCIISPP